MQKLNVMIEAPQGKPNTHIAHFAGDFDGYAKENLTEIQKLVDMAGENTTLIFDFSRLNFLNSYAIGHLVAWHNHLLKQGGQIMIVGLNKSVEDIFSILGITTIFKIYPDLQAALK